MSTQSNSVNELQVATHVAEQSAISPGRRYYWSVRRELWENRGVFLAPAAVAVFVILGVILGAAAHGTFQFGTVVTANGVEQHNVNVNGGVYTVSLFAIMGVSFLAAVFYCLGTLHGERQDRSILFWKSLPVSDLTTVLAKITIPVVVLPAVTMALIVATDIVILLIQAVTQMATGQSAAAGLGEMNMAQAWLMALYHLVTIHALWYAPIYGYAMVVSAWAKRAPLLWAVVPPIIAGIVEKIAFGTSNVFSLLRERLSGSSAEDMVSSRGGVALGVMPHLTPLHFLANPELWLGLVFAAICVAAAIRLRRLGGLI